MRIKIFHTVKGALGTGRLVQNRAPLLTHSANLHRAPECARVDGPTFLHKFDAA